MSLAKLNLMRTEDHLRISVRFHLKSNLFEVIHYHNLGG